ncbi:hypothetical protein [Pandoraea pneumonica]|nr:hypothetical protein [Pandoraea pneumonica]
MKLRIDDSLALAPDVAASDMPLNAALVFAPDAVAVASSCFTD